MNGIRKSPRRLCRAFTMPSDRSPAKGARFRGPRLPGHLLGDHALERVDEIELLLDGHGFDLAIDRFC